MSERMNIALLWTTTTALVADLIAVCYMMVSFNW